MSGELERRALELHARSLELVPEEREAFLRSSAADSRELLDLLLRMLRVQSPGEQLERTTRGISLVAALHLEGRELGEYRIVREIGGGAVGRVYEAEQLSMRRRVAVKVLRLEHCQNEEMLRRFRQEPELQGRLQHPNIVKVLSTGVADGWHYFAMEFVQGTNLAQLIEDRKRGRASTPPVPLDLDSPRACAAMIEKVARAVHFAHLANLVHRDIKPHNILIDLSGEPYVSDFGLCRRMDGTALTASMGDGLRGTLAYMSPEQATEFHAVKPRADVYSLGAVLYQVLTRCLPFEAETDVQLLNKILSRSSHVRPPHHFLPGFDQGLSAICTTALEKDPERRFQSALEMAERLRAFCEGRRVESRPVSRLLQIGERRLDRRKLLKGAAIGAPLVGGAVLAGRRMVHAGEQASLRLELPPGAPPALVQLLPIRAPDHRLGVPVELGTFESGEPIRGVAAGMYRVLVTMASGAFSELQRTVGTEGEVRARATPTEAGAAGDAMSLVPAGRARVEVPPLGEVELECAPFWIDRCAVTNGEFRAFLEATGQWPSSDWTAPWLELWTGKGPIARPENWDDLPVVKVSWTRAREYAEWKGKRLPTILEWLLAVGLAGQDTLEARQRLAAEFALGRPQFRPVGDKQPSTLGAYLEYARPARLDEARASGPHGLWHPFGNVSHWLEPSQFARSDSGSWVATGMRYEANGAWHFKPLRGTEPGEGLIGSRSEGDAAGDLGFRCVKTAKL